jgi:hypothetical protein
MSRKILKTTILWLATWVVLLAAYSFFAPELSDIATELSDRPSDLANFRLQIRMIAAALAVQFTLFVITFLIMRIRRHAGEVSKPHDVSPA